MLLPHSTDVHPWDLLVSISRPEHLPMAHAAGQKPGTRSSSRRKKKMHAAQALCLPPVLSSSRSATKKPKVAAGITPREISKSREALFSCLRRDLPKSDSELSLTDLVDQEYESAAYSPAPAAKAKGGRRGDQHGAASTKGREKERVRRSSSSSSGSGSSSGRGILLNVYVPTTLAQSPSAGRRSRGSDHGREKMGMDHLHDRDLKPSFGGCWLVLICQKNKDCDEPRCHVLNATGSVLSFG
ncbi:hypothetical protein Taro_045306 [Colocasia esculenta]|uniref:Uncharacterized protein n=1 Tax=Colocasia esculenta TaxID=4460 RepID=A0A843WQX1_COLES|nr:hypothetical protein [Colocasia esculenta]